MREKTLLTWTGREGCDDAQIPVDVGIAGLIAAMWAVGLTTLGSCEGGRANEDYAEYAFVRLPLEDMQDLLVMILPEAEQFGVMPSDLHRRDWQMEASPSTSDGEEWFWEVTLYFPPNQIGLLTSKVQAANVLSD